MTLDGSHPIVVQWFRAAFGAPTRCQAEAWPVMAKQLLPRYGVVLREILEREGALSCGKLMGVYRGLKRGVRSGAGAMISISGADPLNRMGIITAGERVPGVPAIGWSIETGSPSPLDSARRCSLKRPPSNRVPGK